MSQERWPRSRGSGTTSGSRRRGDSQLGRPKHRPHRGDVPYGQERYGSPSNPAHGGTEKDFLVDRHADKTMVRQQRRKMTTTTTASGGRGPLAGASSVCKSWRPSASSSGPGSTTRRSSSSPRTPTRRRTPGPRGPRAPRRGPCSTSSCCCAGAVTSAPSSRPPS